MTAVLEIIDPFAAPVACQGIGGLIDVMGTGVIMGAVIGRTQTAHQGLAHVGERPGTLGPEHAARPVGGHDRFQAFRHIVQGLVPAHGTPLACAALSGTDQRPLRTFVISIQSKGCGAPGAQGRPGSTVAVAAYPARHAVFTMDLHRAARIAHAAQGVDDG